MMDNEIVNHLKKEEMVETKQEMNTIFIEKIYQAKRVQIMYIPMFAWRL